jgi:ATP-dependent Clp protease ATP-binding subunit ClpA/CheY-like chemotaxis protein
VNSRPSLPQESAAPRAGLFDRLSRIVVGQTDALSRIVPYLQMYKARLNSPDRPAGVFLLLGPSGTGKTRTVEALAEIVHGSSKHLLKIDCAEYQSDHEVAKLIGAPPGYIGHRETKPLLTQERLLASVSPECDLALVLFDEIEKAAPAFTALLLGLLDRGTLRLGDNTSVTFEKSLVFLTSNLGAREMLKAVQPNIGFQGVDRRSTEVIADRLQSIAVAAVRRRFSPEFINRIDVVISYRPLDGSAYEEILDHHIEELQQHINTRLGDRAFTIDVTPAARQRLLERGTSEEYGARELRRAVHRLLTQPLAALVADSLTRPGGVIRVDADAQGQELALRPDQASVAAAGAAAAKPIVLVLDENVHLAKWLEHVCAGAGVTALTAATAEQARQLMARHPVDLAIVDLMLPDDDGLSLVREMLAARPTLRVVVTSGAEMSSDEAAFCESLNLPVIRKPFLPEDLVQVVQARLARASAEGG